MERFEYTLIDSEGNIKFTLVSRSLKKLLVDTSDELFDDEGFLYPGYLGCREFLNGVDLGIVGKSLLDAYPVLYVSEHINELIDFDSQSVCGAEVKNE